MNRLDFSRLRPLLTHRASHCVSIYMPTHRAGTETDSTGQQKVYEAVATFLQDHLETLTDESDS